jgi:uncharacterized membrane protein
MLRSVAGVVVGYFVFFLSAFFLFRLTGHDPYAPASVSFAVLSIVVGIVVAFVAGYIAAVIGKRAPIWHSAGVGIILALVALVSMAMRWGHGEIWTQVAAVLVMAPSAALGGFLRAAQVCRPQSSGLQYR